MKTGFQIIQIAKKQLAELTNNKLDTVSCFSNDEKGWHVTIEMIEMKRIPEASDMLASYETLLDDEGNLLSYHRTRRYLRQQTIEKEE
jgi:hypothetical protein